MEVPQYNQDQDELEAEDAQAIADIVAIMQDRSGLNFLKYLLKTLDVGQLPEPHLEGDMLHRRLGYLETGKTIFNLVSQANHSVAGNLIAQIEKDRYEKLRAEARQFNQNGRVNR